ncbi:rhomboid-related protein 2-like isoform X1 [Ciona intestinalis]
MSRTDTQLEEQTTEVDAFNVTEDDGRIPDSCFTKLNKKLANLILTTDEQKLVYLKEYNCNPPPLFMLCVSLAELVVFIYYAFQAEQKQWITISSGLTKSPLIYDPMHREEVWRFISYMFLHAGIEHILGNVVLQLMFGLPLEMVHKSYRVAIVYMSGVLAGSLASSIFDPFVYLVGASGGVYALLGGYLSNVITNWSRLAFNGLHLLLVVIIVGVDLGFSIYRRVVVVEGGSPPVSLVAHLAGGLAGVTIGYVFFSDYDKNILKDVRCWICFAAYILCCGFAVFFNLFLSPAGTI